MVLDLPELRLGDEPTVRVIVEVDGEEVPDDRPDDNTASIASAVPPTTQDSTELTSVDCANADVTEAASGGEFYAGIPTSRFTICLDESIHPLDDLAMGECAFGYVSNLSLNGPDRYPIGYEVVRGGECTVRNRDFEVRIVSSGEVPG